MKKLLVLICSFVALLLLSPAKSHAIFSNYCIGAQCSLTVFQCTGPDCQWLTGDFNPSEWNGPEYGGWVYIGSYVSGYTMTYDGTAFTVVDNVGSRPLKSVSYGANQPFWGTDWTAISGPYIAPASNGTRITPPCGNYGVWIIPAEAIIFFSPIHNTAWFDPDILFTSSKGARICSGVAPTATPTPTPPPAGPSAPMSINVVEGDANGGGIIQTRAVKVTWSFADGGTGCGAAWGGTCPSSTNKYYIRFTGPVSVPQGQVASTATSYTTGNALTVNGVYSVSVCANNGSLERCTPYTFSKVPYPTGVISGQLYERTPNTTPTACYANVRALYASALSLTPNSGGYSTSCTITPSTGIASSYSCTVQLDNQNFDPDPNQRFTVQFPGNQLYSSMNCGTSCIGPGITATPTSTPAPTATPPPGSGTGLVGQYYNGRAFESLVVTRTDPIINFDWVTGSPAAGVGADNFSIRWTGFVVPQYTQTYTFYTVNDDGARLWVNNTQIINDWNSHAALENSGTIALTAGVAYPITLEFLDWGSWASISLSWSSASQAKQIIPSARLYTSNPGLPTPTPTAIPTPTSAPTGLKGDYYNGDDFSTYVTTRIDPSINFNWAGSPIAGVGSQYYSVRWTGYIVPQYSQTYTFYANIDNAISLFVNGSLIINDWSGTAAPAERTGTIALTGGVAYPITIEYANYCCAGQISLSWSSPSQAKQLVPSSRLSAKAPQSKTIASARPKSKPAAAAVSTAIYDDYAVGTGQNQFEYVGSWVAGTGPIYYATTDHWSDTNNPAHINFRFTGTQVELQFVYNYMLGIAGVSIDGGPETLVDTYTSAAEYVAIGYTSPVLANTSHLVKIRVTGLKNAASSASIIDFDRADVTSGTPDPTPTPTRTPTPSPTPTTGPPLPPGTGLVGKYYNGDAFTSLAVTRTDPAINFDWVSASPAAGVGADNFTVRWTGFVVPQYTQTYTFYTVNDDGVRLWVDNTQLINDWTPHSALENSGTIALTAGVAYPITLEFWEAAGRATISLSWSSASQAKQIIPSTRLYTSSPILPTPTPTSTPTPTPVPVIGPVACTNIYSPIFDANTGAATTATMNFYFNLNSSSGFYKVKNSSYYDRNSINSLFPVNDQLYDTDDTPLVDHFSRGDDATNYVGTGVVMSNGVQTAGSVGATNSGISPRGWTNASYPLSAAPVGTRFIDNLKNRKDYKTISGFADANFTGTTYGTLVVNGDLSITAADAAVFNNKNVVIAVTGNLNINTNIIPTNGNVAFVAGNIYINEAVTEVRGLLVANGVSLVSGSFVGASSAPLKIVGVVSSGSPVDTTRRARTDSFKPSFFITSNPDAYTALLPIISVLRYDWKQVQ